MPDEGLHTCAYRLLRYTPNLVRDEWVNIGVFIHDPIAKRAKVRLIEEMNEFARVRRLHPDADENLLRTLQADFETQFAEHGDNLSEYIATLDQTLSNVLQLSPQKGVLTEDLDAELDRLYHEQVEPPRYRATAAEVANTRNSIRTRITRVFRSAGILAQMQRSVRVDEFTYPGDPLKLDYSYRRNATRGFVHALALSRDPAQAKVLAYTADCIRAKLANSEFYAITEVEPRPAENERHRFIEGLLAGKEIPLVPLSGLEEFANRLRPTLR
jgi:hypothetical protein